MAQENANRNEARLSFNLSASCGRKEASLSLVPGKEKNTDDYVNGFNNVFMGLAI